MPEFPPTHEQQNILDAVKTTKQNIMIRARAGCGKTTMLELIDHAEKSPLSPHVLQQSHRHRSREAHAIRNHSPHLQFPRTQNMGSRS